MPDVHNLLGFYELMDMKSLHEILDAEAVDYAILYCIIL